MPSICKVLTVLVLALFIHLMMTHSVTLEGSNLTKYHDQLRNDRDEKQVKVIQSEELVGGTKNHVSFSNFLDIFAPSTISLFPTQYSKLPNQEPSVIERIIREITESSPVPILYNHLTKPNQTFALEAPLSKHRNAGGSKTYMILQKHSARLFRALADQVFFKRKCNVFQDLLILVSLEKK